MSYAIIDSAAVNAYINSNGQFGATLAKFDDLDAAQDHARTIANDYHYGVEIVDTDNELQQIAQRVP